MFKNLSKEEIIRKIDEAINGLTIGLVKFEIRTTPNETEAVGAKSSLYKELEEDFSKEDKKEIEKCISEINKKLIELQELISSAIEKSLE